MKKRLNSLKFPLSNKIFSENLSNALGKKKFLESSIDNPYQDDLKYFSDKNNNMELYQHKMLKDYIKTSVKSLKLILQNGFTNNLILEKILKASNGDLNKKQIKMKNEVAIITFKLKLKNENLDEESENEELNDKHDNKHKSKFFSPDDLNIDKSIKEMRKEIDELKTLLKKKRENINPLEEIANQELDDNEEFLRFNNYDKWSLNFGKKVRVTTESNESTQQDKDLMNSLTFKNPQNENYSSLLYNKMKQVIFGSKTKVIKVNNKRQIGWVIIII